MLQNAASDPVFLCLLTDFLEKFNKNDICNTTTLKLEMNLSKDVYTFVIYGLKVTYIQIFTNNFVTSQENFLKKQETNS